MSSLKGRGRHIRRERWCPSFGRSWTACGRTSLVAGTRRSARTAAGTNGLDAREDGAMRATVGNGKPRESWVVRFRLHVCRRSAQVGPWDVASPLRRRDRRADRGHPLAARQFCGGPRSATLIGLPAVTGIRVGEAIALDNRSRLAGSKSAANAAAGRGGVPTAPTPTSTPPTCDSTAAGTSTAAATTTPVHLSRHVTPACRETPRISRTGDPLRSLSEKVRARGSKSKEVLPRVQV